MTAETNLLEEYAAFPAVDLGFWPGVDLGFWPGKAGPRWRWGRRSPPSR